MVEALPPLVIHNIGELVTCDPVREGALGIRTHVSLVARSGRITDIVAEGTTFDWKSLPPDTREIDAKGNAVVPGFVDAHTHAAWLGERRDDYLLRAHGASYESIAEQGGGIASTIARTKEGSAKDIAAATAKRLQLMIRSGTTTVEVKSGYGGTLAGEQRQLQAITSLKEKNDTGIPSIIATYLPLHTWIPNPDARERWCRTVATEGLTHAKGLASFVDVFCEKDAYAGSECVPVLKAARTLGLGIKIHAEQRSHSGGAKLAATLGATSADHLDHVTVADAKALAGAKVVGVLLPGASLILDGPPPPGRMLIEEGVEIAIATDCNPGTSYTESMPLMLSLAVAYAGLTPEQALIGATRSGAHALGLHDRGIIAPGNLCDLVILEGPSWIDIAYHLGHTGNACVIHCGIPVHVV